MRSFIVVVVVVLFCIKGNSQKISSDYKSVLDRTDIDISNKTITIDSILALHLAHKDLLYSIEVAHEYSRELYRRKLYKEAIKYSELEISLYQKLKLKNDKYAGALYNLALFYAKSGEMDYSHLLYKEVVKINTDEYSKGKALCELGFYYFLKGDFYKAKDYYTQGIFILEKFDRKKLLIKKYLGFSHLLGEMETYDSSLEKLKIMDKTDTLIGKVESNFPIRDYISLNNDYANYYNSRVTYNFDKAKYYYYRNLKIALEVRDSSILARTYSNLGNLYVDAKNSIQRDSAHYFLRLGLRYNTSNEEKSLLYHNLSNYYDAIDQYKDALEHIHKSLTYSIGIPENVEDLPDIEDLSGVVNKYNTLVAIIQKATILIKLYRQENDLKYAELALSNLISADNLIDILLKDSVEEGSRLYWRKEASEIYFKGILVCKILGKKEKAFYFSEKKKSLLLTEDIIKNIRKSQLSDTILQQDIKLKRQILSLENHIIKLKNNDSVLLLKNKRFLLKQRYENLQDSLKFLFPKYYKERQTNKIVDVAKIQETLKENEIIISYVSNQDEDNDSFNFIYAVFISSKKIEIVKIGELNTVENLVLVYREQLSKPFENEEDRLKFRTTSSRLYQQLIPNKKLSESLDGKHLIIIPDGVLQYIPFESLVKDKDSKRYLIQDNEVSYAYSMSFLKYNGAVQRTSSKNLVSFAPVYFTHDDLEDISDSEIEIEGISKDVVGDKYFKKQAAKNNFLSNTKNYKIIHLATHANFSDNLQIAFHDTNLEYHELYTYKNQAELVVLSACNTSIGKMEKGEGVMSLARGFFNAGSNTVISSLWNANDKSTAIIMEDFYQNLSMGESKSQALHNAKINYLSSASLSDASPYYWATFVLIGDAETKLFSPSLRLTSVLFLIFFVLIISIVIYFFKKR